MTKSFAIKTAIVIISFVVIVLLELTIVKNQTSVNNNLPDTNTITVEPLNISQAIVKKAAQDKINFLKEEEIKYKVYLIEVLLERYNSPMKGLGRLIYDRTTECGGDYKVVVAIAGNESGFGRVSYKLYNPFGYLDGVQYDSFEHAVDVISCKIAERFLAPCNNDLTCVINKYGGHDTDKPKWIRNISYFMGLI